MPENLERLKKTIEEKNAAVKESKPVESVDLQQVERIVEKMQKKYSNEGLVVEESKGRLGELRGMIAESKAQAIQIQKVEELAEFKNPTVKALGKFFISLKTVLSPVSEFLRNFSLAKEVGFYLYSANMPYSASQWIALVTAASVIAGIILTILGFGLVLIFNNLLLARGLMLEPIMLIVAPFVIGFFGALFVAFIGFLYPKSMASQRGEQVSIELPFALRHMATELRAGIGLYKSLQAVSAADYGVLSEEFQLTIREIEEGTDAKDALKHLAYRTQSRSLRIALTHIVRALKTGGNLSETMNQIAETVTFDLQTKIKEFSEKMNFFGIVFIFLAIVTPVMVSILGSIRNAPLGNGGQNFFSALPLTPELIFIFYVAIMPLLLGYMVFYLKMTQPRV